MHLSPRSASRAGEARRCLQVRRVRAAAAGLLLALSSSLSGGDCNQNAADEAVDLTVPVLGFRLFGYHLLAVEPQEVLVSDLDGDARQDVGFSPVQASGFSLLWGTGRGSFLPGTDLATDGLALAFSASDFDGSSPPTSAATAGTT
jgi:hypothetical protein